MTDGALVRWNALSVRQPYAYLILAGVKKYEARTWHPTELGAIFLHASARSELDHRLPPAVTNALRALGVDRVGALPRGVIVGIVDVVAVIQPEDAAMRRIPMRDLKLCGVEHRTDIDVCLWKLRAPFAIPHVACGGRLGLWPVPAAAVTAIRAQLTRASDHP